VCKDVVDEKKQVHNEVLFTFIHLSSLHLSFIVGVVNICADIYDLSELQI